MWKCGNGVPAQEFRMNARLVKPLSVPSQAVWSVCNVYLFIIEIYIASTMYADLYIVYVHLSPCLQGAYNLKSHSYIHIPGSV